MIRVAHLTKTYTSGKGVFDLNFEIPEGEVFGFLGPNGSGKTTTIRHLLGFMKPDQGSCTIGGLDCFDSSASIQKKLGYVPGEISFFDTMTGLEFLNVIAAMRGLKDGRRRDALIDRFELESHHKIRKMSKGMKQKVGLIAAFMHDPAVLILDEPTSGLDPLMQRRFIELINEEKARGKTVLLSTHIFNEVDRTCQRAAIIRNGRIVDVENLAALKSALRKAYTVQLHTPDDVDLIMQSGLSVTRIDPTTIEIQVTNDYTAMLTVLAKCHVVGLEAAEQSLEQIFLSYYGQGE